jgi:hypothetical protein
VPINKAPRPLPINVHRNRSQTNRDRYASNSEENIPHSLSGHPIIQIIDQPKSKHVLDKIHSCESFTGFLTMAVNDIGHNSRCAELDTEVDKSKSNDDGDFPGILGDGRLTPREEAGGGKEEICYHDGKAKFGFYDDFISER